MKRLTRFEKETRAKDENGEFKIAYTYFDSELFLDDFDTIDSSVKGLNLYSVANVDNLVKQVNF